MIPFFSTPERLQKLVSVAQEWLGTPFYPHGRVKRAGVSCQTLPECLYRECGFTPPVTPSGSLRHFRSTGESLIAAFIDEQMRDTMEPVLKHEIAPGDLLLHFFPRCEHAGIALPDGMFIHAGIQGVAIQRRDDAAFLAHLARVWRPSCHE